MGNTVVYIVIGAIAFIVAVALWVSSRYKTPRTNEAFVVSGAVSKADAGLKVLTSKGGFIWPVFQRYISISLRSHQIITQCEAISNDKIKIQLRVAATFKIGSTEEEIRKAAQRFAQQEDKIDPFVKETLEGSMRAIVGQMTVESLLVDRAELAAKLREEITDSLAVQGLSLDTLQIQDINDQNNYIDNLGKPQEAAIKQKAAIAEAEAQQEAQRAQIEAQKQIALANRDLQLQQAQINEETSRRNAEAEAAKPIAEAEQQQKIADEQAKVELKNVEVTKAKLLAEVNAKADAEKYRRQTEAQAEAIAAKENAAGVKDAKKLTAEGDADAMRTSAEAEAAAITAKAKANAEAIRLEGEAKAEALKAQGLAEAEAMQKKADAYRDYGQAALQAIVIEKLPEIAGSISKHLEGAKITAVNANATDQVAGLTTDLAVKAQELVKTFTGLDIADSLKSIASRDDHTVDEHDQPVHDADHLTVNAIDTIEDAKTTAADKTTD